MIEVSSLSKRYGNHLAVDNVSFSIKKGEVVGFLGPNGAGKSTIMNIMTGYLSLTVGSVSIDGFDIMSNPEEAKRRKHASCRTELRGKEKRYHKYRYAGHRHSQKSKSAVWVKPYHASENKQSSDHDREQIRKQRIGIVKYIVICLRHFKI